MPNWQTTGHFLTSAQHESLRTRTYPLVSKLRDKVMLHSRIFLLVGALEATGDVTS